MWTIPLSQAHVVFQNCAQTLRMHYHITTVLMELCIYYLHHKMYFTPFCPTTAASCQLGAAAGLDMHLSLSILFFHFSLLLSLFLCTLSFFPSPSLSHYPSLSVPLSVLSPFLSFSLFHLSSRLSLYSQPLSRSLTIPFSLCPSLFFSPSLSPLSFSLCSSLSPSLCHFHCGSAADSAAVIKGSCVPQPWFQLDSEGVRGVATRRAPPLTQ